MSINLHAGISFENVDKEGGKYVRSRLGARQARVGNKRNAHRVLARKPEETAWKTLGTGKDNIKINLKERVWAVVELINVVQNRHMLRALVNTVMSLTVAQNAQNILIR